MRNFIREMRNTFIFHVVASHFVNGLVPVAGFFMLLTLMTANPYFEHTVLHLICIAAIATPVAFLSGIRDWRIKFHGSRAPIFYRKIKLSIILAVLCVTAISIRLALPNSLAAGGGIGLMYGGCISMALPVVVLLGHLGGKLANAARGAHHDREVT